MLLVTGSGSNSEGICNVRQCLHCVDSSRGAVIPRPLAALRHGDVIGQVSCLGDVLTGVDRLGRTNGRLIGWTRDPGRCEGFREMAGGYARGGVLARGC